MSHDSTAARALLAHFNNQLAGRLVRRLLKDSNAEAFKRIKTAVFDLLPEACKEKLWNVVLAYTDRRGREYIGSGEFEKKADKVIKENADYWITQALQRTLTERVMSSVSQTIKSYDVQSHLKGMSERYKVLVYEEIRRLAKEAAKDHAK